MCPVFLLLLLLPTFRGQGLLPPSPSPSHRTQTNSNPCLGSRRSAELGKKRRERCPGSRRTARCPGAAGQFPKEKQETWALGSARTGAKVQRAEAGRRERGGRHRLPPDPDFRAHKTGPRERRRRRRGSAGRGARLGSIFSDFPLLRLGLWPPPRPGECRGPGGSAHRSPTRPPPRATTAPPPAALAACARPGPAHPAPAGGTDSRSLPTPRPQTRVPVLGGRLPGLPRGGQPPSTPTPGRRARAGPLPKRQSRRARSPSRAGRRVLPLTD